MWASGIFQYIVSNEKICLWNIPPVISADWMKRVQKSMLLVIKTILLLFHFEGISVSVSDAHEHHQQEASTVVIPSNVHDFSAASWAHFLSHNVPSMLDEHISAQIYLLNDKTILRKLKLNKIKKMIKIKSATKN